MGRAQWLAKGFGVRITGQLMEGAFMVLYAQYVAMITLPTTSISRSGKPLRAPMPRFHMIRSDAEVVVTYLKSLKSMGNVIRTNVFGR